MTRAGDFPDDLVEEILCRVPATYLKGLRSTCQRWNRLYKDKRFARKHFDKSPKQFLYLMATGYYRICPMRISLTSHLFSSIIVPSLELNGELSLIDPYNNGFFDVARVFHCDGLLLCISQDESRMVVWNPLTRETRWIQRKDPTKGRTFILGYCNNSKSHKILFSAYPWNDSEMYDFSSDSWRILDGIAPGWSLNDSYKYVSLKGNAYMFARHVANTAISLCLLKFDFTTEKSVTTSLPRHWNRRKAKSLSVVREEKIAMLLKQELTSKIEIWLSNKIDQGTTKVVSWSMILALDLSSDLRICRDSTFLLDEEKKLLVYCTRCLGDDGNTFFDKIYIVGEDSKVTKVVFRPVRIKRCWPNIHNYVPSLVRINQVGYKRKRGDS